MEDAEETYCEAAADNSNIDSSTEISQLTQTRPTRRLSLVSNEENIEMVALGGSRQHNPEPQHRQNNQNQQEANHFIHWFYPLLCLTLTLFSFSGSVTHLVPLVRNFSDAADYWSIFLDITLIVNSWAIFGIVFPFLKQQTVLPSLTLGHAIICTVCNLLAATISYYLRYDWITLAVLLSNLVLLVLLYISGMRLWLIASQNL